MSEEQKPPAPSYFDSLPQRRKTSKQLAAVMTQWADSKEAELRRWFATGKVNEPERPPAPTPVAPKKKRRRW